MKLNDLNEYFLPVSELHTLYIQEIGKQYQKAHGSYLFLHGGPGAGFSPQLAQSLACNRHIIFFAQRGAPPNPQLGEITQNHTELLLEDICKVMEHLGLKNIALIGSSWGACLSLLFALKFPQKVHTLILLGTLLCQKSDLDWFLQKGASYKLPGPWKQLMTYSCGRTGQDLIHFLYEQLQSSDEQRRYLACYWWNFWKFHCAMHNLEIDFFHNTFSDPQKICRLIASNTIELHYFKHGAWIEEAYILKNAHKLKQKTHLIHGADDLICHPFNSIALADRLSQRSLQIIPDAGHTLQDPQIFAALLKTMKRH